MAMVLLCHFDGTNGQTTTTDSSLSAHALTMTDCSLTTANAKFGTAAVDFVTGASTRKVTSPDSADWHFAAGQFTVEAWVKFNAAPSATHVIVGQIGTAFDSSWQFAVNTSGIRFLYSSDGFATNQVSGAFTPTVGQYYHVAADRDASNVLRVYVDGVVKASATVTASFFNASQVLAIGNQTNSAAPFNGYIDELRITKGEAVYGGAFTPPTEAFPDPPPPPSDEARITQQATLVLSTSDSDVRITQAATLALVFMPDAAEEIRITQAAALALAEYEADIRITQLTTLVLADQVPCLTRWAQTWTITRTDGQVFAFTSLDRPLTFRGVVHQPCNSLAASAVELSTIVGVTGSMELRGTLADGGVSETDLYNGLFDGASIEVWMMPWDNAGGEIPFRLMAGVTGASSSGDTDFSQEILTASAQLGQRALLETFTPSCRYEFGNQVDPRCPVDLVALTVTGSATGLPIPNASTNATRRIFTDSTRIEADGFFNLGRITWTSGLNAGATSEVKDFTAGQFILWEALLFPIALTDAYSLTPSCDKSPAGHLQFNADMVDFGGFPDVPGGDALVATPDSRG